MSSKPHIAIAFGTRPEAIKLAPVIRELSSRTTLTSVAIAQHRELLDGVLRTFDITPHLDLDVMVHDQDLSALSARILGRMHEVFTATRPDVLVVQGDTTSAMTAALAAHQAEIPVVHVEAGLRTSTLNEPWPEEANRRVISRLATLHLAPTDHAAANLLREGISPADIVVTGNSGMDAARQTVAQRPAWAARTVLVTCHRREQQRDGFRDAGEFLAGLSAAFPTHCFVMPMHPNPRTEPLRGRLEAVPNFQICPPLTYPEMLGAIRDSVTVVTDSGGVQEECAWFGTRCVVMRTESDRPESVATGCAHVVGLDLAAAVAAFGAEAVTPDRRVFGDGRASARIADAILSRQWTQT